MQDMVQMQDFLACTVNSVSVAAAVALPCKPLHCLAVQLGAGLNIKAASASLLALQVSPTVYHMVL